MQKDKTVFSCFQSSFTKFHSFNLYLLGFYGPMHLENVFSVHRSFKDVRKIQNNGSLNRRIDFIYILDSCSLVFVEYLFLINLCNQLRE